MALQGRPMHVPAGVPLDESTRPELLNLGQANVLARNVRGIERGTLVKRFGFGGMPATRLDGTTRTAGRTMFAHGTSAVPCVIDGSTLDMWSQVESNWSPVGRVPEATYRLRDMYATPQSVIFDTAAIGGLIAVAIGDAFAQGQAQLLVVDADTGAAVKPAFTPPGFANGDQAAVGAFANRYFIASVCDTASGTAIKVYLFDTGNIAAGWTFLANVASSSSVTGTPPVICELGDRIAIAYATTSGTDRLTVATYNQSGLLGTVTIPTASLTPSTFDIDSGASSVLWVAFTPGTGSTASVLALDPIALTTVGSVATITSADGVVFVTVCGGTTTDTGRICAGGLISGGPASFAVSPLLISGGAVSVAAVTQVYNALRTSRPFCINDRYYMLVAPSIATTGANDQNLCVLVDWTDPSTTWRPVANIEPGLVVTVSNAQLPKVTSLGDGKYVAPVQLIKSGSTNTQQLAMGFGTTGCALAEIDFASRDRWQSAGHHGVTALSGGLVSVFDGASVTELGFLCRPTKPVVSTSGTGITGTFSYVAIYETADAAGNWVVSGVSTPVSSGAVTNVTVGVSAAPYTVTTKTSTRIAWYRTTDGGNPPYYRVGATPCDTATGFVGPFLDATDDTDLATHAKLYAPSLPGALGEALDRRAPPGLRHLVSYAGMLVGARGSSILFSGQEVYGEATWFSPIFEVPIPGPGDITALAAMDGGLFAFKSGCVYALTGESPSDNGAAGGFGDPRLLASDVGCIDANSVVVTSQGAFFQSDRGIELLTRSQTVQWIGEPIQDTLAIYPVVTSAVLDARNTVLRISLAASVDASGAASGDGVDLIFDLAVNAWISVDDKTLASAFAPTQSAAYVSFDGTRRYAVLTADGIAYNELDRTNSVAWRDPTGWITAQYQMPPWKTGLQQEQRIYEMMLLFEQQSSAGLVIEVAEDYGDFGAVTADKVWAAADLVGEREVSFRPHDRGTATTIRIRDTDPGGDSPGSGQGFTFIGVSADMAVKQGTTRGTPRLDPGLRR